MDLTASKFTVWNAANRAVVRTTVRVEHSSDASEKGNYHHYMEKEIHEQPRAIRDTLETRLGRTRVLEPAFGIGTKADTRRHPRGHHSLLRHVLLRGLHCALLDRRVGEHPMQCGNRLGVPLPKIRHATRQLVRDHQPVRGNRRHASRPPSRAGGRLRPYVDRVQRTQQFASARLRVGVHDRSRPGNLRRFHQGIHHPIDGC